ncbi:DUF397 domain-containing protein [Nocardiopsis rhodophaea]
MSTDSAVVSEGAGRGESACTRRTGQPRNPLPVRSWRKSSYSDSTQAESCLEIARPSRSTVLVRDSAHPRGTVISIGTGTWREFLSGLCRGDFDRAD